MCSRLLSVETDFAHLFTALVSYRSWLFPHGGPILVNLVSPTVCLRGATRVKSFRITHRGPRSTFFREGRASPSYATNCSEDVGCFWAQVWIYFKDNVEEVKVVFADWCYFSLSKQWYRRARIFQCLSSETSEYLFRPDMEGQSCITTPYLRCRAPHVSRDIKVDNRRWLLSSHDQS